MVNSAMKPPTPLALPELVCRPLRRYSAESTPLPIRSPTHRVRASLLTAVTCQSPVRFHSGPGAAGLCSTGACWGQIGVAGRFEPRRHLFGRGSSCRAWDMKGRSTLHLSDPSEEWSRDLLSFCRGGGCVTCKTPLDW